MEPAQADENLDPPVREPMFQIPVVVVSLVVLMVGVHGVMALLPTPRLVGWVLAYFAFVPERYLGEGTTAVLYPGGVGAQVWTFVTHAFLHGDWAHLGLNVLWLVAFGVPVARRLGTLRFLALVAATAAGGAALHLLAFWGDDAPMIGASGVVSGMMGAAARFAFTQGRALDSRRDRDPDLAARQPAPPLGVALLNRNVAVFIGVWFVLNLVFGVTPLFGDPDDSARVAWQAHIGGFAVGLLAFRAFDPVRAGSDTDVT
jgi:membrane associated rhomboid family serine protease